MSDDDHIKETAIFSISSEDIQDLNDELERLSKSEFPILAQIGDTVLESLISYEDGDEDDDFDIEWSSLTD